jgi:hypothetical protein
MATWNALAALTALADLVRTIPGQQLVMVGAPASMPATFTAYLTVGSVEIQERTTGSYRSVVDLLVTFGYAVDGETRDEEEALAAALDEFSWRVLQNLRQAVSGNSITVQPMLNGSVTSMDPPLPALGTSDYVTMAGQESRMHPRAVRIYQDETL